MEELWNVIKESKQGLEYLPPEKQYKNLVTILSSLDKKEVKLIRVQWWNAIKELINRIDYKDMAVTRGGLVEDVLYDYFGNWIIAQGEELFNDINNDGISSIYKYIKNHNIPKEEFQYESMDYVFIDVLGEGYDNCMKVEVYYNPIEFLPSIDVKEFLITEDEKVDFLRSYIKGFEKYSLLDIKSVHYKTIEENLAIEFFIKTDVAININYGYIDRIYKITEFIEDSVTKKAYVEVVYEGIGAELSLED